MKIAMLAPPWIKIPPAGYGGVEWVIHYLTEELVRRGHEVTLFATGDSHTSARLFPTFPAQAPDRMGLNMFETWQAASCLRRAGEFDVIHDHSGFTAVAYAGLLKTPLVHTLHGPFTPDTRDFYTSFRDTAWYVSISDYQQSCCPELRYAGTVYNPIDIAQWPFRPRARKDDYLLACGRLCADKGFHTAIEVARKAGRRLVIAGTVQQRYRDYYETVIRPKVDGEQVIFTGEVSLTEKWELFSRARALLFPVQWPEPFGLVMIESMAAGTPVIAFPEGSVPEVVHDGLTGFVVDDADEMAARVSDLGEIDAAACRRYVHDRFSVERSVDGYEQVYLKVSGR